MQCRFLIVIIWIVCVITRGFADQEGLFDTPDLSAYGLQLEVPAPQSNDAFNALLARLQTLVQAQNPNPTPPSSDQETGTPKSLTAESITQRLRMLMGAQDGTTPAAEDLKNAPGLLGPDDGVTYTTFGDGLGFDESALSAVALLAAALAAEAAPLLGVIVGPIAGAVAGPIQGAIQGPIQGPIQGAVQAPIQGAIQGAVQGAVQGVVQGVVQGGLGRAVADIRANPVGGLIWDPPGTVSANIAGSLDALSGLVTDAIRATGVGAAATAGKRRRLLQEGVDAASGAAPSPPPSQEDHELLAADDARAAMSDSMDVVDVVVEGLGKVLAYWT